MLDPNSLIQPLAEAVFGYILEKSGAAEKLRDRLGRDPVKVAFKRALQEALLQLERQRPEAIRSLFDADFLRRECAPILARFLLRDGHPTPVELAERWADSLNLRPGTRRTVHVREMEPVAADFLEVLSTALKHEEALREIFDSQALDRTADNTAQIVSASQRMADDIRALRHNIEHNQATPGTLRDYLRWLIERNLYLDPRGTFQTQRQVQLKLEDVYISLQARQEEELYPFDEPDFILSDELHTSAKATIEIKRGITGKAGLPGKIVELAEAVNASTHVVILGDPGSGKTTLLRYLALKHAQALWKGEAEAGANRGPACFPILVRIADYAEYGLPHNRSLSDFLADCCCRHECPGAGLADLIAQELRAGRCLVLLDGLDEIVSADHRIAVVRQIEDFVRRHEHVPNHFVVSSRVAGYVRLSGKFTHYTAREMNKAEMRRFLEAWCKAVEDAQTPDLSAEARAATARREIDGIMAAIEKSPGVARLAANPLLLRTLALIHRTGAQLPQKRVELYKLAADTLARTWRTAQGVPESALVEESYLTRLLGKLAYWLHANKPTGIATEREVYRELGQEWARIKGLQWEEDHPDINNEIRKFLQAVREHTGIFVERAPRRYGFMHLTFEEYYAARYLVARSKTRAKLIRQHLHNPRWNEPILLALGFVGLDSPDDAAELVETAILAEGEEAEDLGFQPSKYEDLLGRDYLFVLRCLGDQIPVRAEVMGRLMKRLVNEIVHGEGTAKFSQYRSAVVEILNFLKGSKAEQVLVTLLTQKLDDPDIEARGRAAGWLVGFKVASSKIMEVLLLLLEGTSSPEIHIMALTALHKLHYSPKYLVETLLKILLEEEYPYCKEAADIISTSVELSSRIIEQLQNKLASEDLSTRLNAISRIRYIFLSNKSQQRMSFIDELSKALQRIALAHELSKALQDENPQIRAASALELRFANYYFTLSANDASYIPNITNSLLDTLHDTVPAVRIEAACTLWGMGNTSAEIEDSIIALFQNSEQKMRIEALISLRFLLKNNVSNKVITFLLDILHDEKPQIRYFSAELLGMIKNSPPEIIPALLDALQDEHFSVRLVAAESLAQLSSSESSEEIIQALQTMLSDKSVSVRHYAAYGLWKLRQRTDNIREILVDALSTSRNWSLRAHTAHFLGEIANWDDSVIQALYHGLMDTYSNVRDVCVKALVEQGRKSPEAQTVIETMLVQAINDHAFEMPPKDGRDKHLKRSAQDYAYEALWRLIVEEDE